MVSGLSIWFSQGLSEYQLWDVVNTEGDRALPVLRSPWPRATSLGTKYWSVGLGMLDTDRDGDQSGLSTWALQLSCCWNHHAWTSISVTLVKMMWNILLLAAHEFTSNWALGDGHLWNFQSMPPTIRENRNWRVCCAQLSTQFHSCSDLAFAVRKQPVQAQENACEPS